MADKEKQFIAAHDEHVEALYRFASFKVSNHELAKDLVQETFTKTWAYLAKGGEIDSLKSFLYRTLNNLIIDEYRKKHSTSLDVLTDEGFDPGFDDRKQLFDSIDGKQAIELLQKLPKKYRDVIFMRYVQELTFEEIAALTKESKNAVTVRVHRGIKQLKKIMQDYE